MTETKNFSFEKPLSALYGNAMAMQLQCNDNGRKEEFILRKTAVGAVCQCNGNGNAKTFCLKIRCRRCMEMQWQCYPMAMSLPLWNTAVGAVSVGQCSLVDPPKIQLQIPLSVLSPLIIL